jgi:glycosidase
VRESFPKAGETEVLDRVLLGHAMLLGLRGVPVVYSGDEQGFTGDGGDQDAREDMFASRVASYNDNRLVGTAKTTATDSFSTDHPIYREIATLAKVRTNTAALRRGRQLLRFASDKPGLFAVSRFDPQTGREYVLAFNTSTQPIQANVEVEVKSSHFTSLAGEGQVVDRAPASVMVALPPLGYIIAAAGVSND